MQYDVAVIGGGPGGYVAAIRAAQLGGKVLLIEKEHMGGVCLNKGCIPTKTLLKSAEKWQDLNHCAEYGLYAGELSFDFSAVAARKEKVVGQLKQGIEQLVKSNGIDIARGKGELISSTQIKVIKEDGEELYEAKNMILATGSVPMALPIPGANLPGVIDSDDLLAMTTVPKSMVVVGAGAVGIEFAFIFQAFGCEVTVVEMLPAILPNVDSDLVKRMGLVVRKQGIKTMTNTKMAKISQVAEGLAVEVETAGKGTQIIVAEKVLLAAGRSAVVSGLGLESAGVEHTRRGITVNDRMETNVKNIYAIGDATGLYMWAHAASTEGIVAAENAMGKNSVMHYDAVPGCIFTTPEIAVVGLTEQEAKDAGKDVVVSRFNFAANGKAVSMGETDGLVKFVAEAGSGKILGMHVMGPHASDLIMEGALAIQNNLTAQDLAHTIHPHPTLCETVMESAHGIFGDIIHQAKSNR